MRRGEGTNSCTCRQVSSRRPPRSHPSLPDAQEGPLLPMQNCRVQSRCKEHCKPPTLRRGAHFPAPASVALSFK